MFRTKVVERNKIYILCSTHYFRMYYGFRDNYRKGSLLARLALCMFLLICYLSHYRTYIGTDTMQWASLGAPPLPPTALLSPTLRPYSQHEHTSTRKRVSLFKKRRSGCVGGNGCSPQWYRTSLAWGYRRCLLLLRSRVQVPCFPQSFQTNAGIVPQISPRPFSSTSLPVN
jgi:hypothetical protein